MSIALATPAITATGVELFRAGRQKDSSGRIKNWSKGQLQKIADAYNRVAGRLHDAPAVTDAPLQIGHNSDVSYGWLSRAYLDGDVLKGDYSDVDPSFAEMVNNGRLRKRSISFYPPGHDNNPTPEDWNIRHVAYVAVPAVKGLADHRFGESVVITDCVYWHSADVGDFAEDATCTNYEFEDPSMANNNHPIAIDFGEGHACKVGDKCHWTFGKNKAMGKVVKVFEEETTIRLKGKDITRLGTPENPAILLEQSDGTQILKLASELDSVQPMDKEGEKPAADKGKKEPDKKKKMPVDMAESAMPLAWSSGEVIAQMLFKLRDEAIAANGVEAADKLYPKEGIARLMQLGIEESKPRPTFEQVNELAAQVGQMSDRLTRVMRQLDKGDCDDKSAIISPVPAYTESTSLPTEPMPKNTADYSEELAAANSTIAELTNRIKLLESAHAASFAERERAAVVSFVEGQVGARRIRPVDADRKIQLLMATPNIETVDFGEGDSITSMTLRKALMNEIASGPELWNNDSLPTGADQSPEFSEAAGRIPGASMDAMRQLQVVTAKAKELGLDPNDATEFAEAMNACGIAY